MTTDTYPKVATVGVEIGGVAVTLQRHGQGRRHDRARHGDDALLRLHRRADRRARPAGDAVKSVQGSFNAITVDSDTSTSDTLLLFATGAAEKRGAPKIVAANDRRLAPFKAALDVLLLDLAHQVVKDGEGARKFVEITVAGAALERRGQADRAVDRQFAAGQDRDRGRGRQLGPHRHGRRQGRRKGRPRPARDLVRRHSRRAQGPARSAPMTKPRSPQLMKKPKIDIYVEIGLGGGEATVNSSPCRPYGQRHGCRSCPRD